MTLAILTLCIAGLAVGTIFRATPNVFGLILGFAAAAFFGIVVWTEMPPLAPSFYTLPATILLIGVVALASKLAHGLLSEDFDHVTDGKGRFAIGLSFAALTWILALWIGSLGVLRSDTYRGIIEVAEKPLDANVEIIDQTHARLVDQELANRRALELLGVEKGLGSAYSIGTPTVQMVAGRQVWVAPLEPARFWSWLTNEGTPGYVVVSATNYSDARIVLTHKMHYTKRSWFWNNVERRAWNHAPTVAQTDASFEIDDEGKPYWVISTYDHVAGGAGPKVTGVMVVDAATGGIARHSLDGMPAWIDRSQPEWITEDQLQLWGDYVKGWWNFALDDVVHPTSGMSLVNLRDGRSAWFTGIVNARSQSQNSAATNGFALVDTRTGKATVYYKQGVSEEAAKLAIEGAVQEKRYGSTHPIAYLVHGTLTYVSTLKDNAGNPRLVGMVSALDRSVVAVGASLDDVTRAYAARLNASGARATSLGAEAVPETVAGTLVRTGGYVLDGRSYQMVRIDVGGGTRDLAIDLGIASLRQIVLARPGDRVEVKVSAGLDGIDDIRELRLGLVP